MVHISIICPVYNEEKYIGHCIESIIAQDYPIEDTELLLIDGQSTDNTRDIIKKYQTLYGFIKLLDNPGKILSCAANIGIKQAKGTVIVRIDAHSFFPKNYISTLVTHLQRLKADNVGVVLKTGVFDETPKSLAIKEVLSHPFGVGNALFRIGTDKVTEVDTVPFGCFRKETFEKYGLYDERLVRNQDIEFNKRIKRGGGKVFLIPDTYCVYYARETWRAIMKNNCLNGKWNILTVWHTKMFDSLSVRHFIPMLFLLSLTLPLLLSFLYSPASLLSAIVAVIYLTLISFTGIRIAIKKKLKAAYLIPTFIVLHLSYGFGSITGLFDIIFRKEKKCS